MKKFKYLLLVVCMLLLVGCNKISSTTTKINSKTNPTSETITTKKPTQSSSSITKETSSTTKTKTQGTTVKPIEELTISELVNETEIGKRVKFRGTLIKFITDSMDKLMIFSDGLNYVSVRVASSNAHATSRYENCDYEVVGTTQRNANNKIEVKYESVENLTSTPITFDYSKLAVKKNSIKEVYDSLKTITLNKKGNGIGEVVTFEGIALSTDRSDSNSKAVFYDNQNVITVINIINGKEKKIVDAVNDIDKQFEITGIISILNNHPSIQLLDIKSKDTTITIDYSNVVEVSPSYFVKWYHLSDKQNDPSFDDFSKLYKITGYVNTDGSRTSTYYLGLTDKADGDMTDSNTAKKAQGVYMMNYLNIKPSDLVLEEIADSYDNDIELTLYASLFQYDTQNHAWKVFIYENLITENKE